MLVINLFAGPCAGKSLLAADVFARLKRAGVQAEIPPEVAKIYAQRGDTVYLEDQLSVFAQNNHQLLMVERSGAQVAITDSPLLLSAIYQPEVYFESFVPMVMDINEHYVNLNFYLRRRPEFGYSEVGRVHSESQAMEVDRKIVDFMMVNGYPYTCVDSSVQSAELIVEQALLALDTPGWCVPMGGRQVPERITSVFSREIVAALNDPAFASCRFSASDSEGDALRAA